MTNPRHRARVVIAPDSFKGSAQASEVAAWIAEGWCSERPDDRIEIMPMADGGEGTLDAVEHALEGAERHAVRVPGPTGRTVDATWLSAASPSGAGRTAFIELASTSGLTLARRAPLDAHTAGLGHATRAALDAGASSIVIALGGSASTDGGAGFLSALGARILDAEGNAVRAGARGIASAARLDLSALVPPPPGGVFALADVRNPLLGARGAAVVFGPQKGATAAQAAAMDVALARYAALFAVDPSSPGAGAAGGVGFALLAWGAKLRPGAEFIASRIGLRRAAARADVVITGEGRFDSQTAEGKVVGHVSDLAREVGVPVMLVAGSIAAQTGAFHDAVSLVEIAGSARSAIADPAPAARAAGRRLASSYGRGTVPPDLRPPNNLRA